MGLAGKILNRLKRPVIWDLDGYYHFRTNLQTSALAEPLRADEMLDGISLKDISVDDSAHLEGVAALLSMPEAHYPAPVTAEYVSSLLAAGDRCFIALRGKDVVAVQFSTPTDGRLSTGFAALVRHERGSWVSNSTFVAPSARGSGIQRLLARYSKSLFREAGAPHTFSFVGAHNVPSVINTFKTNDEYRFVYHLSLDLPLLARRNMYLKNEKERWRPCPRKPTGKPNTRHEQ